MTLRPFPLLVLLAALLTGCGPAEPPPEGPPYRVETVPMPDGLAAETGGLAFLPDGRLIACFRRGEVMTYDPETGAWSVFATGLHDPLGILAVSNSEVIVIQRPELTRLRDTDDDGRADVFETVTDQFGISGNYHEFAFGPAADAAGNLYISLNTASNLDGIWDEVRGRRNPLSFTQSRMYSTVPYRGWVLRVSPDGEVTPWASGFRSPNGLGFDTDGHLFVTDNQGDWLGTSKLYHVRRDRFYGHPAALVWEDGFDVDPLTLPVPVLDKMRTPGAVLFPQGILANSPTQPVVIDAGGRFGPFEGQLLVGEMDWPRIIRVVLEEVDGELQGAAIPHVDSLGLRRGNNRLAFAPDGSLWVGQSDHGWVGDRGIQRIVWTGVTPMDVHEIHLTRTGFDLAFTKPVDPETASRADAYRFTRYTYAYHREYGSPRLDETAVPVTEATVAEDGRTVSLVLDELRTGYVYDLQMVGLAARDGVPLRNARLFYTLNRLRP